uniref:CMP/dCMP-type deaminase domain-containing protein n=1 Tax=Sciurus vulgaris TaxID=55149 RepID=A0A8D2D3X0_SCIVU
VGGEGEDIFFCASRNQIRRIHRKTFLFHFRNLRWALGRHNTFLCYQVDRKERDSIVPFHMGVLKNQTHLHAELCFLYWLHDYPVLFPSQHLHITWYVSWSPCCDCAEQVSAFLASHANVSLTIYAARLYYFWRTEYQEGLRKLQQEGARVRVMSLAEFKHCWENFVYPHDGRPLRPWKRLFNNCHFQKVIWASAGWLQGRPPHLQFSLLHRGVMKLLKQETFRIQFNNHRQVPWPHHRRKTYLCYQLQLNGVTYASDYLRNKKGRHAEIRFVEKICSLKLDKDKNYNITCYLTWSPCPNCARKLVDLKRSHPHLTLRLFTSRLYYHWFQKFQEGLHLLWTSQVPVTVMGLQGRKEGLKLSEDRAVSPGTRGQGEEPWGQGTWTGEMLGRREGRRTLGTWGRRTLGRGRWSGRGPCRRLWFPGRAASLRFRVHLLLGHVRGPPGESL